MSLGTRNPCPYILRHWNELKNLVSMFGNSLIQYVMYSASILPVAQLGGKTIDLAIILLKQPHLQTLDFCIQCAYCYNLEVPPCLHQQKS